LGEPEELNLSTPLSVRRGELDVIADILTVASEPVRPTRILYGANLSYRQMQKYLPSLVSAGLMTERRGSCVVYETTDKGLDFLAVMEAIRKCPKSSPREDPADLGHCGIRQSRDSSPGIPRYVIR